MGTLTASQIESERSRLMGLLAELQTARKLYAKNPAMMAVVAGRAKAIKDRLYELERFATGGPTFRDL